jgi:hypothetical protein
MSQESPPHLAREAVFGEHGRQAGLRGGVDHRAGGAEHLAGRLRVAGQVELVEHAPVHEQGFGDAAHDRDFAHLREEIGVELGRAAQVGERPGGQDADFARALGHGFGHEARSVARGVERRRAAFEDWHAEPQLAADAARIAHHRVDVAVAVGAAEALDRDLFGLAQQVEQGQAVVGVAAGHSHRVVEVDDDVLHKACSLGRGCASRGVRILYTMPKPSRA